MELNPKPYIVFWISQYDGNEKSRGFTTPKFKPNMATFATYQQAEAIQKKLAGLAEVKARTAAASWSMSRMSAKSK